MLCINQCSFYTDPSSLVMAGSKFTQGICVLTGACQSSREPVNLVQQKDETKHLLDTKETQVSFRPDLQQEVICLHERQYLRENAYFLRCQHTTHCRKQILTSNTKMSACARQAKMIKHKIGKDAEEGLDLNR